MGWVIAWGAWVWEGNGVASGMGRSGTGLKVRSKRQAILSELRPLRQPTKHPLPSGPRTHAYTHAQGLAAGMDELRAAVASGLAAAAQKKA